LLLKACFFRLLTAFFFGRLRQIFRSLLSRGGSALTRKTKAAYEKICRRRAKNKKAHVQQTKPRLTPTKTALFISPPPPYLRSHSKHKQSKLRIFFSLLLALTTTGIFAQGNAFVSWSVEQGLPQSQVYALCQDTEGYLWVGTQGGGIARFDGRSFEKVSTQHGLPSDYVSAMCSDSVGQVWAGTSNGLATARVGKALAIKVPFTVPITCLLVQDDALYIGTTKGLYLHDKKTHSTKQVQLAENQCVALATDAKGKVFLATAKSVFCLQKQATNRAQIYKTEQERPGQFTSMLYVSGYLYVGTNTGILERIAATDVRSSVVANTSFKDISALASGASGHLLIASRTDGICEHPLNLGGMEIQRWDESKGLPRNDVRTLLKDRQGQVWVGTSGGGLARLAQVQFQTYTAKQRLPDQRIYATCRDTNEQILVSAGRNGIWKLEPQGYFVPVAGTELLNGLKCRTLAVDKNGQTWAGTEGSGVFVFADSLPPQKISVATGHLPSDVVQKIICLPNGNVLIATTKGMVELTLAANQSTATWVAIKTYEFGTNISAMQRDSITGRIWFGTSGGRVAYIENGAVTSTVRTGIASGMVTSMVVGANKTLYVSTKTSGIYVLNTENETRFRPMPDSLSPRSRTVYLLAQDASGKLWAGTESGVYCIDVVAERKSIAYFGASQGFTGLETCQDAAICDAAGRMWFGTMNGLMQQVAEVKNTRHEAIPYLHFQEASLFYKPLALTAFAADEFRLFDTTGAGLVLPFHQNHLRFDFAGFNPANTERVLYRYRLIPTDADWSPWTEEHSVQFASLQASAYTLAIQAKYPEQVASKSVTARFTITAPWWQTLWFRLALAAAIIALIIALVWWYIRRVKRVEREKRAQLEIQNKLLALEQKALQLQMNPHFIFNALNSIQSFITTQNHEKARSEMTQFSRLMRSILQNSRKQTISLQEEMQTLRDYLAVEQNLRPYGFEYEVVCAPEIDPEDTQIPSMLLQPFVENAIIHGVAQLKEQGKIRVTFHTDSKHLICTVTDNGIGREKAKILAVNQLPGHQSAALEVTNDRLRMMGGAMHITDLVHADGSVTGTQVVLYLPF
jgi:ligand-binding sensor domain-containing protein/two-component sensor histidine kinase